VIAVSLRSSGRRCSTITFPSTLHLCPVLDLLLSEVPRRWHAEIRLGLQEALVNAAKHGNNLDPTKYVSVEFFSMEDQYWWVISDQGSGFAPNCCCTIDSPTKPINDVDECGRGLFILHQVFDHVQWNHDGTELRLCKQVNASLKMPLLR
jgi:serine/threonine-protein kinase RsbW